MVFLVAVGDVLGVIDFTLESLVDGLVVAPDASMLVADRTAP